MSVVIDTIKRNPVIALVPIGLVMIFILKKYNVDEIIYTSPQFFHSGEIRNTIRTVTIM